jgi:hypothetical protein
MSRFALTWFVVAAGCGYYDSSLLKLQAAADSGTAGAAGQVTCEHAGPPDKPSVVDAGGDIDIVLALSHISFGIGPDAGTGYAGYDVDKTCTCQGEDDSCLRPAWASAPDCDQPGGRDNAAGELMKELASSVDTFGEARFNADVQAGIWTTLSRIRNYNGLADDDQVEISWYVASDFWSTHMDPDGGKGRPKWDGTDEWPISTVSLKGTGLADGGVSYDLDHPISTDKNAYVSGGVAVGMLPKGMLPIDPNMKLVFSDLYLTGRLVNTPQGWALEDGVLAGVWTLEDIFSQLGHMVILGLPACIGSPPYAVLKGLICKRADIYRSRGTPTTPCDSLSVGLSFASKPARLGAISPPADNQNFCTPETDPSTDSCDKQ